ncbi:MAG: DUF2914 domain-containing protein [Bradymonadaceae bacterium]|nr:DUF2914 domain-containing protein [Lujinxingiaceae bacterium]
MLSARTWIAKFDARIAVAARARLRRWMPACFFVAGFAFDALTLGGEINPLALMAVCGWAMGAALAFFLQAREFLVRFERWIALLLHLCLGSLFSALAVLYFRSAGHLFSLLIVAALGMLMLWNEFGNRERRQRELLWGIYCVSLVMLFNVMLPYLLGSVRPVWFYVSTAAAVALIWALKFLANVPITTVRTASAVALMLAVAYPLGLIPPVPLVMESSLVGTDFKKSAGQYLCQVEPRALIERVGLRRPTVHRAKGEAVYVLSAVSAPPGAQASLEHRWRRSTEDGWKTTDTLKMEVRGGRKGGWRFYSRKRNTTPGLWRVETALVGGAVLGYETFIIAQPGAEQTVVKFEQAL